MPEGVKAGTAYVDIDADLAKLKKTVDEGVPKAIDGAAAKASKQATSRFAGIGAGLKKGLAGSLGQISGLQLGGGVTALGAGLVALSSPLEKARAQLKATFVAAGKNIDDYKGQIASTERQQENYGHTTADTDTALRKLTTAFQDPKKALKEMGLVANIAASQHISLADAAALDVKAHAGSTKIFKQFGINVALVKNPLAQVSKAEGIATKAHTAYATATKKLQVLQLIDSQKKKLSIKDYIALKAAQDKVTLTQRAYQFSLLGVTAAHKNAAAQSHILDGAFKTLSQRVKGQASAAVDSFSGKLEVWKTKIQDVAAKWGEKLGPILVTAGPLIAGLGGILSSGLIPTLGATAVAEDGVAVSTTSMLWPIVGIIAAIALVAAGVIYAYTHFKTFHDVIDSIGRFLRDVLWPIVKTVFTDIWLVIKTEIGLAIDYFKLWWTVLQWAWTNIGEPIFGYIKGAVSTLVTIWGVEFAIAKAYFTALWTVVTAIWNTVGHPVFHAIGIVVSALRTAFSALKGAVVAAFTWMGDKLTTIYNDTLKPIVDKIQTAVNLINSVVGQTGGNQLVNSLNSQRKKAGLPPLGAPGGSHAPINARKPGFTADGGIFSGAQTRIIGEAGPEAVIPLSKPARAAQLMRAAGLGGGGTTNVFNIYQSATPDQILAAQRREERLAFAGG